MTISDKLFQKLVLAAISIGFLLIVIAGATSAWVANRNQSYSQWVDHTHQVEERLSQLRYFIERAETARRGYLLHPDDQFHDTWADAVGRLPLLLTEVRLLTQDNARQGMRIAQLSPLIDRQAVRWRESMDRAEAGDVRGGIAAFQTDDSARTIRQIRTITTNMVADENRLLVVRRGEQRSSIALLYTVLAVAGILVLLVAIGSVMIIRSYTRDLQRANDEIQRFAYIVSHDLRSPLVNVMGFTAELASIIPPLTKLIERADAEAPDIVTKDARLAVTEDLPESLGFIRSSTEKMDRLINAILQLSREGRRTLSTQSVDMRALFTEIRGTMQHVLVERGIEVRVEDSIPPIVSDRLALEQMFSNLIENAVKYLKPGRPGVIIARGHREGPRVIYEVEDNGRGIDPRDHERIFDLFRRSGTQDVPGEGIGLAHVRALAYRLGGVISCDAALDRGAIFRVSLPASLALQQGSPS